MFRVRTLMIIMAATAVLSTTAVAEDAAVDVIPPVPEEFYDSLETALETAVFFPAEVFPRESLEGSFEIACRMFNTSNGVGIYGLDGGVGACIDDARVIVQIHEALASMLEMARASEAAEGDALVSQFQAGFAVLNKFREAWMEKHVFAEEGGLETVTL